jgi:hypothetical protein
LSIIVAAGLVASVAATVVVAAHDDRRHAVVRAIVTSETQAYFDDPAVVAALARAHVHLHVDVAPSRTIATSVDLSRYDVALVAGADAPKIRGVGETVVPFSTPVVFGTFTSEARRLAAFGVAQPRGATWSFDLGRYLALAATARPPITTSDVLGSTAATGYAALAARAAAGNRPISTPRTVDAVINDLTPLFPPPGAAWDAPLDWLEQRGSSMAIATMLESEFVARTSAPNSGTPAGMTLLYPDPGMVVAETLVPLDAAGTRVGRALSGDARLQQLAVRHGFRTTGATLPAFASARGIGVPATLAPVVDPPGFDVLDALATKLDIAQHMLPT